jgi:hypothetical protein
MKIDLEEGNKQLRLIIQNMRCEHNDIRRIARYALVFELYNMLKLRGAWVPKLTDPNAQGIADNYSDIILAVGMEFNKLDDIIILRGRGGNKCTL